MERCEVKVIKDSIHNGNRLITYELKYPYYIHAEVMTHRVFSRNGQSFRAIPIQKLIEKVREEVWYPIFMENQKGMAASVPIIGDKLEECKTAWDEYREQSLHNASCLATLNVHKQVATRLLLPFSRMVLILSTTELDNFFNLRISPGAQQEIQELAIKMHEAKRNSKPTKLDVGQWHLPYLSDIEIDRFRLDDQKKISSARCARVSYLNHEGSTDPKKDIELHDSLLKERHMSPFEHVATPHPDAHGNFVGWEQYRYYLGG